MTKFIIIAIILIISYSVFLGLMKAAGKRTPSMPDLQVDKIDEDCKNQQI